MQQPHCVMKKIKVVHIITRMDWGGSPDIVRILCQQLDSSVYETAVLYGETCYPSAQTSSFLALLKDRAVCIPHMRRNPHILYDCIALYKLWRLLRKGRYDIVHTHTAKAGMLGRIAAFCSRTPCIIHCAHGHNFYGYAGAFFSRAIIFAEKCLSYITDHAITLTELEKKDLIAYHVMPVEKISVIASGVEFEYWAQHEMRVQERRAEFGLPASAQIVGMIGRLEPVKGILSFMSAAALAMKQYPQTYFLIVGEGSLRQKAEEAARAARIEKNCIFTGWRDDIPDILPLMDMLVVPSINEAVGRVIIEAAADAIPAIATRVGGIPEIVHDQQTGILVPPDNPAQLAEAIMALLQDAEKRMHMGAAAQVWVRKTFAVASMVEKTAALYQRLLQQ